MKNRNHFIQAPLAAAIAALCIAGPAQAVNLTLVNCQDPHVHKHFSRTSWGEFCARP